MNYNSRFGMLELERSVISDTISSEHERSHLFNKRFHSFRDIPTLTIQSFQLCTSLPSDTHFLFYFSSASVTLVSYKILAALRGAQRDGPDYAVKIKFPRLARGAQASAFL